MTDLIPSTSPRRALPTQAGWDSRLMELANDIARLGGTPLDAWEVTARLESLGWTDAAAREQFGVENVFELAREVFPRIPFTENTSSVRRSKQRFGEDIGRFTRGVAYVFPWLLLFLTERSLGTTIAEARRLSPEAAAAVSVAIMLSLVTSGGFLQAMARRGLFYQGMEEPALERAVLLRIGKLALAAAGIVATATTLAGFYAEWVPDDALLLGAGSFLCLSLLWLACGMLAIRRATLSITVVFTVATLVYLAMARLTPMSVATAQLTTFGLAAALSAGLAYRTFFSGETGAAVSLPDVGVLAYLLFPYFVSGAGYFAFLFADRWIAGTILKYDLGVPFTAHPEYQLGADLALLWYFPLIGLVEVAAHRFTTFIHDLVDTAALADARSMVRRVGIRYALFLTMLGLVAAGGPLVVAWFPETLWLRFIAAAEDAQTARRIGMLASIGYGCLALGLFNMLALFSFSQARPALRVLMCALGANLAFGYVLGHQLGYGQTVWGLVIGGAVWATLGTLTVWAKLIRETAYRYYTM